MSWRDLYDSTKDLYRKMMFDNKWTITQIDEMDVHFFFEMLDVEEKEKEVYLSEFW